MPIIIKNAEDIAKMRVAGRLANEVLDYITPMCSPASPPKSSTACAMTIWSISKAASRRR